jgi:hypothetical protein
MNNPFRVFLAMAVLISSLTSCSDDDGTGEEPVVITVDDAAEFVAASLAVATYGAVDNMDYVSEQIVELIDCNESESDTRTNTETSSNGNVTANYVISESYSRTCSEETEVILYNFSTEQTTMSNPDCDKPRCHLWNSFHHRSVMLSLIPRH